MRAMPFRYSAPAPCATVSREMVEMLCTDDTKKQLLLEGGGFEVIDLGVNVAPEKFIATVKEKGANIIAMSALLTTTMPAMKTTIEALKQAGVREQVRELCQALGEARGLELRVDRHQCAVLREVDLALVVRDQRREPVQRRQVRAHSAPRIEKSRSRNPSARRQTP